MGSADPPHDRGSPRPRRTARSHCGDTAASISARSRREPWISRMTTSDPECRIFKSGRRRPFSVSDIDGRYRVRPCQTLERAKRRPGFQDNPGFRGSRSSPIRGHPAGFTGHARGYARAPSLPSRATSHYGSPINAWCSISQHLAITSSRAFPVDFQNRCLLLAW